MESVKEKTKTTKMRNSFSTTEMGKEVYDYLKTNFAIDEAMNSVIIEDICPQILSNAEVSSKRKNGLQEILNKYGGVE